MQLVRRNSLLSPFMDFFNDDPLNYPFLRSSALPAVNIREDADQYQLEIVAPGMKKEDFKLTLSDGTLMVSAEHETESEEKQDSYRRQEYSFESFSRSFVLPDNINTDDVKADYKDGVLAVSLKKQARALRESARLIPIA